MPNHPTLSDHLKNVDVCSELSQFSSLMDAYTSSLLQSQTHTWIPRKPQKGNEIVHSIYRSHVITGERPLKWTSPHIQIFQENMSKVLPESHLTCLFKVMAFSLNQVT